jgi:RimJ/RimL family protein N-acetyltransferase
MIIETTAEDYSDLIAGRAPRGLRLADSPIADQAILHMLADVAARVSAGFTPAAWLIVEDDEVAGLCSITRPPTERLIDIGYGVAPTRQDRGIAGRAIGALLDWARADPRIDLVTAETATANLASQRVLERNGFVPYGERVDEEDGPLIRWRYDCRA